MARFIYCFLQNIKQRSSLPLVEPSDQYVLANDSKLPTIADEQFLLGIRVLVALNKVVSSYLKKKFRREAWQFLEELTNSVLPTVAAPFNIGQGIGCFCLAIVIVRDNHAALHQLGLLLDRLPEKGRVSGSEIEACSAEHQPFVQEQQQLERSSTRNRPDVRNFQSICSLQAGFRVRRHLLKVCIVTKSVKPLYSRCRYWFVLLQVFQLTAFIFRGPMTSSEKFVISLDRVVATDVEVRGALLCVQDFVWSPHFN